MSASGSRLARQIRPHLGTELWDELVEHTNRHYKADWLRARLRPNRACCAALAPSMARCALPPRPASSFCSSVAWRSKSIIILTG